MLQAELELGSLLYRSGATGGRISDSIRVLNQAMGGGRVCIDLGVETLHITIELRGERREDTIEYDPPTSMNATALSDVSRYLRHLPEGLDPAQARVDIAALDRPRPRPGLREFAAMICFMIIFGYLGHADLWSLPIIAVAVLAALLVREALTRSGFGYFLPILGGTVASTTLAALMTMALPTHTALIAMVVPCIILMPGFQLINGGWEIFRHHLQIGIPRIVSWLSVLSMLTLGLLLVLFFYAPAQESVTYGLSLLDKVVFFTILGGIISFCFCVMVGAPRNALVLCIVCGALARLVRTAIVETGGDVSLGTFAAALVLSLVAVAYCVKRAPEIPVVLPLVAASIQFIPSYYAILSLQGMSQIIHLGAAVPYPILATTFYNGLLAIFIVAAIVFGTVLPLLAIDRRKKWF
jgi:uncharacterized membrane protein YjjP (DUF1212 family)